MTGRGQLDHEKWARTSLAELSTPSPVDVARTGLGRVPQRRGAGVSCPTRQTVPEGSMRGRDRRSTVLDMSENAGGPALDPTLSEWLKARAETEAHLAGRPSPIDVEWAQRLADLLTTERSWQDQYTELIALGSIGGKFPSSNR